LRKCPEKAARKTRCPSSQGTIQAGRPSVTKIFEGYGTTAIEAYDAGLVHAEAAGYTAAECSTIYVFISHHPLVLEAILTRR
jgi:hypothetical protein